MEHKFFHYQNKKIHYQDEGAGNTLVLLHGFMNSIDVWASFVYAYMRNMRVIAIDLPGHGKTDNFAPVHTMDFMAETVKVVLDYLQIEKCVMVGHSMGGYVAVAFASKYPAMLKGFGMLHSHAMVDDEETKINRLRTCKLVEENRAGFIISFIPNLFYDGTRHNFLRDIENLQEASLSMKTENIIAAQQGMLQRPSHIQTLLKTNAPVLFIFGKKDERIDYEIGTSHAMCPKHAEILILDNIAHMGHIEAKIIVRNRIKSFVENCFSAT